VWVGGGVKSFVNGPKGSGEDTGQGPAGLKWSAKKGAFSSQRGRGDGKQKKKGLEKRKDSQGYNLTRAV